MRHPTHPPLVIQPLWHPISFLWACYDFRSMSDTLHSWTLCAVKNDSIPKPVVSEYFYYAVLCWLLCYCEIKISALGLDFHFLLCLALAGEHFTAHCYREKLVRCLCSPPTWSNIIDPSTALETLCVGNGMKGNYQIKQKLFCRYP